MLRGFLAVNHFLRGEKYGALYAMLGEAAARQGATLEPRTNAELTAALTREPDALRAYDFCLFWDKDVLLGWQLERLGLRLFNSADGVLACDDKALTYLRLLDTGLPMPRTVILPKTFPAVGYGDVDWLGPIGEALGYPLVLKECFGSFGQQVYWMADEQALREKVQALAGTPLLAQALVTESVGRDVRVNVVGGRAVVAMLRESRTGDFRSNISNGGSMRPHALTRDEADLAERAAGALGLDFAGVDVLLGRDGPVLCEVNSNPHFASTLRCTGVNLADEILRHIREALS